jgi:Rrf2 family protein
MPGITEPYGVYFGQYDLKRDNMLCPELSLRIYESLKTLCCLAAANRRLQAHEVAVAASLPPAQTAKILQQMAWAGFVESRRGAKGGFWLQKPAESIRVTDVADFFRRPAQLQQHDDPVLQALARATEKCNKEFRRITIADLSVLPSCKTPPVKGERHRSSKRRRSTP